MQKAKSTTGVLKTPISLQESDSLKTPSLGGDGVKGQDENKVCYDHYGTDTDAWAVQL